LKMAMEMLSEKDIRNIKRKFGMLKWSFPENLTQVYS
jgi:hypothetical protein